MFTAVSLLLLVGNFLGVALNTHVWTFANIDDEFRGNG